VLGLAGGLSMTLPMQRAREQLRPLVSEADVRPIQETLREDGAQRRCLGEASEAGAGETEGAAIRWSLQTSCVTARVASGC
jgi:hypothetical protein